MDYKGNQRTILQHAPMTEKGVNTARSLETCMFSHGWKPTLATHHSLCTVRSLSTAGAYCEHGEWPRTPHLVLPPGPKTKHQLFPREASKLFTRPTISPLQAQNVKYTAVRARFSHHNDGDELHGW